MSAAGFFESAVHFVDESVEYHVVPAIQPDKLRGGIDESDRVRPLTGVGCIIAAQSPILEISRYGGMTTNDLCIVCSIAVLDLVLRVLGRSGPHVQNYVGLNFGYSAPCNES